MSSFLINSFRRDNDVSLDSPRRISFVPVAGFLGTIDKKLFQTLEFEDILRIYFLAEGLDYESFNKHEKLIYIERWRIQKMCHRFTNMVSSISPFKLKTPSVQHDDEAGRDNRVYQVKSWRAALLGVISYAPLFWLINREFSKVGNVKLQYPLREEACDLIPSVLRNLTEQEDSSAYGRCWISGFYHNKKALAKYEFTYKTPNQTLISFIAISGKDTRFNGFPSPL